MIVGSCLPALSSVNQQFIAFASHVHDADVWVEFETATESGDEYLKAAVREEMMRLPISIC